MVFGDAKKRLSQMIGIVWNAASVTMTTTAATVTGTAAAVTTTAAIVTTTAATMTTTGATMTMTAATETSGPQVAASRDPMGLIRPLGSPRSLVARPGLPRHSGPILPTLPKPGNHARTAVKLESLCRREYFPPLEAELEPGGVHTNRQWRLK